MSTGLRRLLNLTFAAAGVLTAGSAWAQSPAAAAAPTFAKDVAPIFYKSCVVCHRPDSIAPMSLITYEDARPWARSIKTKISARDMPPWFIERNVGIQKFKDDPSLSDEQVATIVKWVDSGAPKGNAADMPPVPKFQNAYEWAMGKPDLVVSTPEVITVPAVGPDWWTDQVLDPKLTEDRYIQAVESKPLLPKSEKVIHHATTSMKFPDGGGGQLNEYAVGKNADIFPDGVGKLIKAGTLINMNIHQHSVGEEIKAGVSVAFKFYPKGVVPKHVGIAMHTADSYDAIDVPAGTVGRVDGYELLTKPTKILSFQPHLHNRGTRQCAEAIFPNGKVETLSCARFNFEWMIEYSYADDVAPLLPAYTTIHVISWYDNTTANKYNPDPRNMVGFGNRSVDEMAFSWMNAYQMTDEEFKQEVADRVAMHKATSTNNQQQH
jgi:mono/diheme cytochrome c family protein